MPLRETIDDSLKTDSDLDAFCLDHFSTVYRRFSSGMERNQKVNLLLQLVDAEEIENQLRAINGRPEKVEVRFFKPLKKGFACLISLVISILLFWGFYKMITTYKAKAEYLNTLNFRANNITNILNECKAFDLAKKVEKLHAMNICALDNNDYILSHEITRSINAEIEKHNQKHIINSQHKINNPKHQVIRGRPIQPPTLIPSEPPTSHPTLVPEELPIPPPPHIPPPPESPPETVPPYSK